MNIKLIIYHLPFIIRRSRGFTLIELMVALSITAILGTLGIAGFVNYNKAQVLQTSANEVVTMLNLAKSRAQSQVKLGTSCSLSSNELKGYHIDINSGGGYTLSSRCSSGSSELYDDLITKTLPNGVIFNEDKAFFFPMQKGGVETEGSIIISSGGKTKTITVNALGGVSVQ